MNSPPVYTLFVGPGGDDLAHGLLTDPAGNTVATFSFIKSDIDRLGKDLRSKALEWTAAHEDRCPTKERLWKELHEYGAHCFSRIFGEQRESIQRALRLAGNDARMCVK